MTPHQHRPTSLVLTQAVCRTMPCDGDAATTLPHPAAAIAAAM